MQLETILLANGIFLLTVFAILLSISHRNGHNSPKVKEDIEKIKKQINE